MDPKWPPADDSEFLDIPEPLRRAHDHSSVHRVEVLASSLCGCFYCLGVYPPSDIVKWIDDAGQHAVTAICPKCGIDSVLGDQSGFPLTKEFLEEMQEHWFGS